MTEFFEKMRLMRRLQKFLSTLTKKGGPVGGRLVNNYNKLDLFIKYSSDHRFSKYQSTVFTMPLSKSSSGFHFNSDTILVGSMA